MTLPTDSLASLQHIERCTAAVQQRVVGRFGRYAIASAFQPIYSFAHRRCVGHEALLRARDEQGQAVAPPQVFATTAAEEQCVFLDRLCRNLHVRNFLAGARDTGWLFLNVNPIVSVRGRCYGTYFAQLLAQYGLPAHRVVIEVLEGAPEDEGLLAESVQYYKDLGCLVAIDDFGAGHSNFERLWRVRPHIVKLDRALIDQASRSAIARRALSGLVSVLHGCGSLAVVEGIETEEQALIALEAGADFAQGYHFARPGEALDYGTEALSALVERYRDFVSREAGGLRQAVRPYVELFEEAGRGLGTGQAPAGACAALLEQSRVERCYFLDPQGLQRGANLVSQRRPRVTDPRFLPLEAAEGAVWSQRPYFRQALDYPGTTRVTGPYLSVAGGNWCVTLSVLLETPAGPRVFCVDLDWSDWG